MVLVGALGASAFLVYGRTSSHDKAHAATSSAGGVPVGKGCEAHTLRVSAAPDIAPVVTTLLKDVHDQGSSCPAAAVTAATPAQVTAAVAADPAAAPDVWIPDSSLRLAGAQQALGAHDPYPQQGQSLAVTPVVVAVPQQIAQAQGWTTKAPDWSTLLDRINDQTLPRFTISPPDQTTEGLLGVVAISAAMSATNPDQQVAAMKTFAFRSNISDAATPAAALYAKLEQESNPQQASTDVGAFISTEQALWAYDHGTGTSGPGTSDKAAVVPFAPVYPSPVTAEADYPAVLSHDATATPDKALRANSIIQHLTSPQAAQAFGAAGFRGAQRQAPSAAAGGVTFASGYSPPATAAPGVAQAVGQMIQAWAAYQPLPFRVLILMDGSGSMNDVVPGTGGKTKADIVRSSSLVTTQLLGRTTDVGVWQFDTNQNAAESVKVPVGPLDTPIDNSTRRAAVMSALTGYQPTPGSGTPLYKAVLDAEASAQQNYQQGAYNEIFLLTDGRDGDSTFGMTQAQFLSQLRALQNPKQPVPIFAVGYGTDADMPALNAMAQVTGGIAVPSVDPNDIVKAVAQILTHVRPATTATPNTPGG